MADAPALPLLYLDTNVFIIGIEGSPEGALPVRSLIAALCDRPGVAITSELTLAELLAQVDRGGGFDKNQANMYLDLLEEGGFVDLRPVSRQILIDTADLRRSIRQKLPDAIHIVTARSAGCRWFMSADKHAKRLPSDLVWLLPDGGESKECWRLCMPDAALLDVSDLSVAFRQGRATMLAVDRISFRLERGRTLAIVGESGSGKSVTALSIVRLLPYPAASHPSGQILFKGNDLLKADEAGLRAVRGAEITMVFQEPMTSLNPLHTIERQIAEILRLHGMRGANALRARVVELLEEVGLPDPTSRLGSYPHQLSGGQRQRIMIAMALANRPDLFIADEPTTALDVTVQAQILKLLKDLQAKLGMALLFITHDLGIVRRIADDVAVMQRGKIVEAGPVAAIFERPQHPYTKALLAAEPKGSPPPSDRFAKPVVTADNLRVWFPIKRGFLRRTIGHIKAVDGVSIVVREGQTLGVVGESGSGKTTLAMAILRLIRSEGPIVVFGRHIEHFTSKDMRPLRRDMQVVFQDPYGSLSPRLSVAEIVEEGLLVQKRSLSYTQRREVVARALADTGLDPAAMDRYPHEFSGGQRQRIAIARAMALEPKFVVLDEPTSALDMSVQAQIVDLLRKLQQERGLAYLFISHDLKVVRALASDIIVMRQGKVVEAGEAIEVFRQPHSDYTKALFSAAFRIEADVTGVVSQ